MIDNGRVIVEAADLPVNADLENCFAHELAVARVRAAAEVAHALPVPLLLTARSENLIHGRNEMRDAIRRLQAFSEAAADVLYAPGLRNLDEVRTVVTDDPDDHRKFVTEQAADLLKDMISCAEIYAEQHLKEPPNGNN